MTAPCGYILSSDLGANNYALAAAGNGFIVNDIAGPGDGFVIGQELTGGTNFLVYEAFIAWDTSFAALTTTPDVFSLGMRFGPLTKDSPWTLEIRVYDFGATVTSADWRTPTQLAALPLAGSVDTAPHNTNDYVFIDLDPSVCNVGGITRFVLCASTTRAAAAPTGAEKLAGDSVICQLYIDHDDPGPAASSWVTEIGADSPYIWYRLNEPSGTVANDASGNGNTGEYYGTPTLGAAGFTSDADTAIVTANGDDEGVLSGTGPFTLPMGDPFALEAIVSADAINPYGLLCGFQQNDEVDVELYENGLFGEALVVAFYIETGFAPSTEYPITADTPTHVIAEYDASNLPGYGALYVNGARRVRVPLIGLEPVAATINSDFRCADDGLGGDTLTGTLDECIYYTHALGWDRAAVHNAARLVVSLLPSTTGYEPVAETSGCLMWLKDPLDPSRNLVVELLAPSGVVSSASPETQVVQQPNTSTSPVVLADVIGLEQFSPLTFIFTSDDGWFAFERLRKSQRTLLLQLPYGDLVGEQHYVRFGATRTVARFAEDGMNDAQIRRVTIDAREVSAP